MYKYIFNTKGKYVAFIIDDKYCFSRNNDYIGFFKGIDLYDYSGKYLGTLTSDDRVIKDKSKNVKNIIPISKPYKPYYSVLFLTFGVLFFLHKNLLIYYYHFCNYI